MPVPRHIVVLAYDGVSLLDLSGPLESFIVASSFARDAGAPSYVCSVVSSRGGRVRTADGIDIVTKPVRTLGKRRIDTLIVPGAFSVEDVTRDKLLVRWVRARAGEIRRVCSVCIGTFLLAEAGVLDQRRATTHWLHAGTLAARYPAVTVDPDAIFVHDKAVWSSAGVTTGIDLALALIEQDAGRKGALAVARMLVVYLKRSGGQSQYSALLQAQSETDADRLDELDRWIAEHLRDDLSVEILAARAHMSPRNFARVYAAKRGRTPAKAVEALRVDAARRRLEESDDHIHAIAEECGFGSYEQMRCAFLRNVNVAPREYRRRFTLRH